jgi:hypothetical protein
MYQFFCRLLGTAPTSPFDPFRGRDNRSVGEKAVSGLRLAGGLVAGFLVLVLAGGGLSTLPTGAPAYGRYGVLASWSMLSVASVIMLLTAHRWASWMAAPFGVAVLKTIAVLLFGPNPHSSIAANRVTRTEALAILVVSAAVIALIWRFIGAHPAPTTFLDRFALTFFVLTGLKQMTLPHSWPPLPLISGLSALLIAWCAYLWVRTGTRRKQHLESSTTFGTPPES